MDKRDDDHNPISYLTTRQIHCKYRGARLGIAYGLNMVATLESTLFVCLDLLSISMQSM